MIAISLPEKKPFPSRHSKIAMMRRPDSVIRSPLFYGTRGLVMPPAL
jgi:hypothetical protein